MTSIYKTKNNSLEVVDPLLFDEKVNSLPKVKNMNDITNIILSLFKKEMDVVFWIKLLTPNTV